MVGESIGNFRVTQRLGEGGMGVVYLAEHPTLGRRAAVKVLHPNVSSDDGMVRRFFNEARAANAIGHSGIVEALDYGLLPSGAPYIVMELLEGESVAARMRRVGSLAIADAVAIAEQAAEILAAAHEKGIVHRDLKPEHLFLARQAQRPEVELVKILDFGIAKLAESTFEISTKGTDAVRTRTGTVMGTPQYMSPEQCRDARDVDHRADIYSLGAVIHEMVAGTPPFTSHSWGELVHLHISVPPPPLRSLRPDVPEGLEALVLKALQKDPEARFSSMTDVRAALRQTASPGSTLPTPMRARTPQRRRWPIVGGMAIALAGAIAMGVVMAEKESPEPPAEAPSVTAAAATERESNEPAAPAATTDALAAITVDIETQPSGARVVRERDGAVLGVTPLRLSWPRGADKERLSLERDGYRSEHLAVPLDRGLTARLNMAPLAKRPNRRAPGSDRGSGASGAAGNAVRAGAARPPATLAPTRKEPLKI